MKIVIACDVLGKKNNGTSIAGYNLIDYLKSKGHDVKVICCDCDKSVRDDSFIVLDKLNLGPLNKILERNGVTLPKTDKEVILNAVKDCDIVHVMMPFTLGCQTARIAKELGKPVTAGFHVQAELVSSHFGMMNMKLANDIIYKTFYKNLYKSCDAVHYPTLFIKQAFEDVIGQGNTNGYIISNGVNRDVKVVPMEKEDSLKDNFVILTTGRMCKEKSQIVLLKAIAKSKYNDKIQLVIAGHGPLKQKLIRYSKKHLKNQPIMRYFSREDMLKLLNSADLYAHPAEVELEGIAVLEAVVCGLVPIVSDSSKSATKNFALGKNNIFIKNNSLDLKDKIEYWIEHPEEKAKTKEEYIKFGKQFNQDDCMNQMERMFEEVLSKKQTEILDGNGQRV